MSIVTEAPAATVAADPSPRDELPDHVMSSVQEFITPFFFGHGPNADGGLAMYGGSSGRRSFLREIERTCELSNLPWHGRDLAVANAIWEAMVRDRALAVKVIDYALADPWMGYDAQGMSSAVSELDRALRQAGANYTVVQPDSNRSAYALEKRISSPTAATMTAATATAGNASDHLTKARKAAFGQQPDPSKAYWEAVKAVEAAAIPVVTPKDPTATLGKILGELRNNPQKFSTAFSRDASLGQGTTLTPLQVVIALADLLWKNQTDKHGSPQPSVPITQTQAEAGVMIAVTLVEMFRRSAIS
jgi:hypothetical protein